MFNKPLNVTNETSEYNNVSIFEPSFPHVIISSLHAIIIFVGSSVCLLAFATLPALRTPFNYYLISILLSELLLSVYQIFVVLQAYHGYWPFSKRACTSLVFIFFCCAGVVGNGHFLISVNRTQALLFPHHYRIYNTKRITIVSSASIWIASAALILPWAIVNEPFLKEPIIVCRIQTYDQYYFSIFVMVLFVLPTAFVMGIYPILFIRNHGRRRIKASLIANKLNNSQYAPFFPISLFLYE